MAQSEVTRLLTRIEQEGSRRALEWACTRRESAEHIQALRRLPDAERLQAPFDSCEDGEVSGSLKAARQPRATARPAARSQQHRAVPAR